MARCRFVLLAISLCFIHGCWVGPDRIAKMNTEEIRSVSNKDLCFAYDRGDRSSLVVQEVSRRDVDCVQVLSRVSKNGRLGSILLPGIWL